MAANYELPEEVNEKRLRTLGMEVEMTTFKTNVSHEVEAKDISRKTLKQTSHQMDNGATVVKPFGRLVKLFCVGSDNYPGGRDKKGVFIEDYLQVRSPQAPTQCRTPTTRVRFYFKMMTWQKKDIKLHLQILEIAESDLNAKAFYFQFSFGALVFWEAGDPSSLEGAKKWRQNIRQFLSSIPCVLITDNVPEPGQEPLQWIGPGKIFENDLALDQFCKDHGFVDHFEIKLRDWESGQKSVLGQAVNSLLNIIV